MQETEQPQQGSFVERRLPIRYLYLRTHDDIRAWALTTRRQILIGVAALAGLIWLMIASGGFIFNLISAQRADAQVMQARAASERLNADLQARLESAVARMSASSGGMEQSLDLIERRHAALTLVMQNLNGVDGAAEALAPAPPSTSANPIQRLIAVRMDQERLLDRAETFAQTRGERLRLAFRLAGLNPAAYTPDANQALGGPLIEARDPRALAAILDVDEPFAVRIRHAARSLHSLRNLTQAADTLPFSRPTGSRTTSGFGVRIDPFDGRPAIHEGQDFADGLNTPVYSTAPGVVAFAGVRSGYGNTVEIDHGNGFKTRYAHLNTLGVETGQPVALGQRLGAMGTTGRSTGVHLHYEVWLNGRPQNPARFLRAGDQLVQQD